MENLLNTKTLSPYICVVCTCNYWSSKRANRFYFGYSPARENEAVTPCDRTHFNCLGQTHESCRLKGFLLCPINL